MRSAWAKRTSELVRPGGFLVAIVYPITDKQGGPPYSLNLDM